MKIIHCFRTPLGGLFRHVLDLARWQAEQGFDVGLVVGDLDEWPMAREKINALSSLLTLGVHSYSISRLLDHKDVSNLIKVRHLLKKIQPDVVHGHGAKGGVYARLCANSSARVIYTPHGGSLHYSKNSVTGMVFLTAETLLEKITDGIIFESRFAQRTYLEKVGTPACSMAVIYNGLHDAEFEKVNNSDAEYQLGFIGELRFLKGVDTLLGALSRWPDHLQRPRCIIVGAGRDERQLKSLAIKRGVDQSVDFVGAMPAREAFVKAKLFVLPSKAESLPYVVLEVLAARIPVVVTNVGGIAEIYGDKQNMLIEPENEKLLSDVLVKTLQDTQSYVDKLQPVYQRVSDIFRVSIMAREVTEFYFKRT